MGTITKQLVRVQRLQPEGPSFTMTDNSLLEWQKWRLRISITPRECVVFHDIHFDYRSVVHRLSFSELTVPYCDPPAPYHRKQAFDYGDAGAGRTANNLGLSCDCLGAIKYIDANLVMPSGKLRLARNVCCIHGYEVQSTTITNSTHIDASPLTHRVVKIPNSSKMNPVSGRPVSYKFAPTPMQLLIADTESDIGRRAKYARHHVWVTRHADYEFWAGGEFTNMSHEEEGGCYDAAALNDDVENTDVVVWAVFSFAHSPRVEDWPVMPVERHELHLRPADFSDANPALDVASDRYTLSVLVGGECCANGD